MNKEIRYLEIGEGGWTLPALIARLIEAYECNRNRAAYVMRFKYLQGRRSIHASVVPLEIEKAIDESGRNIEILSDARMSHNATPYLDVYESLLSAWYAGNGDLVEELTKDEVIGNDDDYELTTEELNERGNLVENPYYQEMLRREVRYLDNDPAYKEGIAIDLGIDPTLSSLDIANCRYQTSLYKTRTKSIEALKQPNEVIFWAKELIGRLPSIAKRFGELDSHVIVEMKENLPGSVYSLFEEANLCRIFDLDIACTLICGDLIEEAFQVKFPLEFKKWDQDYKDSKHKGETPRTLPFWVKIEQISKLHTYAKPAIKLANNVWNSRSTAMHRPEEYLKQMQYRAKEAFLDTREVLNLLFVQTIRENGEY